MSLPTFLARHESDAPVPPAHAVPWCMPFSQLSETEVFLHLLPVAAGLTAALESDINLLQPGCGYGAVLRGLAWRFPKSRFAGVCDFPVEATIAVREARQAARLNLWFRHRALSDPGFGAIFDAVLLLAFNPAVADESAFAELAAQLKPGGVMLMQVRQPDEPALVKLDRLLAAAGLTAVTRAHLLIAPGDMVCAARR